MEKRKPSKAQMQRDNNAEKERLRAATPSPPPEPVDPMEGFEKELEEIVRDDDLSRNHLLKALGTLIQEVWDAAYEKGKLEGFEEGEETMQDESRVGVMEALATIGKDWETGRNLLERALGVRIFGLGTNQVEMF